MAETKVEGISEPYEADILIPARDLLKAKDIKRLDAVMFHNNGDVGKARLIDNEGEKVISLIQGNFPNTDGLYPKQDHVFRIGLSCDVLASILKIAGRDNFIKLTFYGESQPVKFEVPRTNTQGIAMPYAVQWPETKEEPKCQISQSAPSVTLNGSATD